jgi:hypothetical protein
MARAGFDQINRRFGVIASEAKQSRAAEPSSGRDCFVARCAPRNDITEIRSSSPWGPLATQILGDLDKSAPRFERKSPPHV